MLRACRMPNQNKECQQYYCFVIFHRLYIMSSFTQCRYFFSENIWYYPNIRDICLIECGPCQAIPLGAKTHNQIFILVVRLAIISLTHSHFLRSCLHVKFPSQTEHCLSSAPPVTAFNPSVLRRGGESQHSQHQGRTCVTSVWRIPADAVDNAWTRKRFRVMSEPPPGLNHPPPPVPRSWITLRWSWHGHRLETDEPGVLSPLRIMLQNCRTMKNREN